MMMTMVTMATRMEMIMFTAALLFNDTVEPRLTTTPLIRPPCYYGHFILAQTKTQSVIFQSSNTAKLSWPVDDRINGVPL